MLWAAVLLWVVAVIALTLAAALREFSRSGLLAECKRRGHEDRFRAILDGDEAAHMLTTWLAGFALVAATVTTLLGLSPFESTSETVTLIVSGIVASVLFLAILPNAIATVLADRLVDVTWPALSALLVFGRPIIAIDEFCQVIVRRLFDIDEDVSDQDVISEEIDAVVDEGERDGRIEQGVSQMIQRVVELQNVDVRDVMTPRTEIVFLSVETPLAEARTQFIKAGHSRIPVIGESPDDMLGVVYAKDLLHADDTISIESLLREPLIVPETTAVDQLLERMRGRRMHIAMIFDEYGGVVGLVTLEDILEEIVGDISDEFDPEEQDDDIVRIDDRTIEVDARTHLDDLNDQFEYELPEDVDFETIGGFVFAELGRVPDNGETLTWQNLEFTVLEADRRKISRLQIRRLDAASLPTS